MDVGFFLRQRTAFIRAHYDRGAAPFLETQRRIEVQETPYDQVSTGEDDVPPFLDEWIDAKTSLDLHNAACVSLLSDSLKLYLDTLRTKAMGFAFDKPERALIKKRGFLAGYRVALAEVFGAVWTDCPVKFDVVEQVVLVRNRSQHADRIHNLNITHDAKSLGDRPSPIFADSNELRAWREIGGGSTFLRPSVVVSRDALFGAAAGSTRWRTGSTTATTASICGAPQPEPAGPGSSEIFDLLSAARSALDLCGPALALFEARLPGVVPQAEGKVLVIAGR